LFVYDERMDFPALLEALTDPAAYPRPAPVEVRQTHLSVAFLVGDTVFKIRKPVNLGFVDFTTLEKRKHDCDEEVRLNRRLAPAVYRGIVPITIENDQVRVGGQGEPIEWAVEMVRLPDDATLKALISRDDVTVPQIEALAHRLAEFHRAAARGEDVSRFGHFDVVAGNARENFSQTANHVGVTVRQPLYDRVRELTEQALAELKPLIESRAERGVPCDTHGDLHLSHVYLFPDRPPPDNLVIIDCIEFAERFRFADPVADLAFLVMDLQFHGRRDLARACAEAYFAASGDEEGTKLLPFYVAYRAVVRAKVEGMQALEAEVPEVQRNKRRGSAGAHWRLALGTLEDPLRRPALVLVGGLPGTGKSTLSRTLANSANFTLIRSDVIRKESAGVPVNKKADGIYTDEWTDRTYDECGNRVWQRMTNNGRVIMDASFTEGARRTALLWAAKLLGVPAVFLVCRADPALVRKRLRARRGDASDADEHVYEELATRWEADHPHYRHQTVEIDTTDAGPGLEQALDVLRGMGLA
jgi:aminoglycoside phosphotransferase family enzyme/predicted kinase